ncbi:MAG TPA: pyridoxal-phosphate dependent enzyme, partial [Candidatus Saccharimonadales bacterium]|nr:pyridoxal-phosphate dependent enzyme [Candidatus Saccharimonadales bacterium]
MPALEPLDLAHLPTPLEPARNLGRRLGIPLLFKRDDCTGLATGGNKARKLAWIVADALRAEADTLVTFGGIQSNHARMTAAAAARSGLGCT